MRLLHTSDWHLGHNLFGRKRTEEFSAFLSWLKNLMNEKGVDVLLVSGDIFDTTTPSNQAQELYYEFFVLLVLKRAVNAFLSQQVITIRQVLLKHPRRF